MTSWKHLFRDMKRKRVAEKYRAKHGDIYSANGLTVEVPASVSANVRYLLAKGRPYEEEEADYIRNNIAQGTNVLELGGSIGVISRLIRATIGPDAQHIIVEANPDLAPICAANAQRDSDPAKTELVQGAVAYTDKKTIAFSRGETAHSGHVARKGDADTFDAPVLTLADLVARMPKGPWALVSDIEGGEYDMFLHEPAETFAGVACAIVEIHPKAFAAMGGSEDAFFDRVAELGFVQLDRTADVILLRGPAA